MISKTEIEQIIRLDFLEVLSTKTFYHYTNFLTATDLILKNFTLQFSDPTTFNDPFDCNEKLLKFNFDESFSDELIKQNQMGLSRLERRKLKREFNNPENIKRILNSEKRKYKISCFSKYYDEVLLWSHYADKHKGICIGFNFPYKYDEKFILCPVKYINEIKPIDGMSDTLRIIMYWLTTKSKRWEYEQEIRAICKNEIKSENEYIKYDPKYINEIIFGCNVTDSELKNGISKLLKNGLNTDTIQIKRMKINEQNFLLKSENINVKHI